MSTRRVTGDNNHAGDLAPLVSAWGQELFAATPILIDQPIPIGWRGPHGKHGYGGTVGAVLTRQASIIPLTREGGYFGDVPQSAQPYVSAPNPWERP